MVRQEVAYVKQQLDGKPKKLISRAEILKHIPRHCFEKNLFESIKWGIRDYLCWAMTFYVYRFLVVESDFYQQCAPLYQWLMYIPYVYSVGFFMWCIFVVGHDCGHGSFSEFPRINAFFGHIFHGSVFVPFWPWALSHRMHHLKHNHKFADYSNPWHMKGSASDKTVEYSFGTMPLVGWFMYILLGKPDGTHFLPLPFQRLYSDSAAGVVSSISCFVWLYIYQLFLGSFSAAIYYFTIPSLFGMGWWLFTVTYFQHHSDESKVFTDDTFDFEYAAFETIDRTYGKAIDAFHHRITDCHVIHHLFFTKIPHYHLRDATDALVKYLQDNDLFYLYKYESTRDFAFRIFYEFSYRRLTYKELISKLEM